MPRNYTAPGRQRQVYTPPNAFESQAPAQVPARPSAAIVRSQVAASNTPPVASGGGGGSSWGPSRTTSTVPRVTTTPAASTTPTLAPLPVPNAQADVARQNEEATRRLALSSMQTPAPQQTPAATPSTPKAPKINLPGVPQYSVSQELAAARQSALDAMRPSSEEDALAQQLAQFRGDTRMGLSRLEGQGRGIPLDLIRGQQAQLAEQAGIQEQTLMERLAAQQAQRQMAAQVAQAQLGFTQQDVQAQQSAQQAAYEQQLAAMKPIETAAGIVQYNPETGQYENVYAFPGQGAEGFTLSPGQARYDAQGNLIASGGTEPLSALDQARIEQIYAEMNQTNDPMERALKQAQIDKIYSDISKVKTGTTNIPASAQEKLYQSKTLLDTMKQLEAFGENLPGTGLTGLVPAPLLSEEGRQVRNILNILKSEISKIRGGSTFTKDEKALIESFVPTTGNWDVTSISKLAGLKEYLETLTGNIQSQYQMGSSIRSVDPASYYQQLNPGGDYNAAVQQYGQENVDAYLREQGFPIDLSMSQNGSSGWVSQIGSGTITQGFNNPASYIKGRSIHGGLDIDGKIGDPVSSPISGRVIKSGSESGWGNTVVIEDAQGNQWRIAHLNNLADYIRPGTQISKGTNIGQLGNTGYVLKGEGGDGSHVHMEIKDRSGRLIDPHQLGIV